MRSMLPPRPFFEVIALRAFLLWAFVRAVTYAGSASLTIGDPVSPVGGPPLSLAVFVVVLLVTRIELARRGERLFLANMGCSFTSVATLMAIECAALETALRLGFG